MADLAYQNNVPASYRAAFVEKVKAVCSRLSIDPNALMVVIRFESANTFSSTVRNPNSSAVGLIQFTNVGASAIGTTTAALAQLTAVQQLDAVEKYLMPYRGRMNSLYDVYLAVFSPSFIGKPDSQKVYTSPANSYNVNKVLDADKDGAITIGEIKSVIARYVPTGFEYLTVTTLSDAIAVNSAGPIITGITGLFLAYQILKK